MKKILTTDNKKEEAFLRKKVPPLNFKKERKKELRMLVKEMRKIMNDSNGVGLSANQVGLEKRLFVAQLPDEQGKPKLYAVINPEITRVSSEKIPLEEGCLSTPDTYGTVSRADKTVLEGYSIEGKKLKINAWGFLAQVFQHEVDHLDGKLFTDKAKEVRRIDKSQAPKTK